VITEIIGVGSLRVGRLSELSREAELIALTITTTMVSQLSDSIRDLIVVWREQLHTSPKYTAQLVQRGLKTVR
jgi:hypothetical protein